ncbi:hypothetical protein [Oceanospirillum linum]|uniref:hypothetical protein n=1 Tax=Oceanospirillum linum TaxID=966 RepID=UPI0034DF1342
MEPWVAKITQWIQEGRTPYMFLHTPSNRHAPEVATYFAEQLNKAIPGSALFTPWPEIQEPLQDSLF